MGEIGKKKTGPSNGSVAAGTGFDRFAARGAQRAGFGSVHFEIEIGQCEKRQIGRQFAVGLGGNVAVLTEIDGSQNLARLAGTLDAPSRSTAPAASMAEPPVVMMSSQMMIFSPALTSKPRRSIISPPTRSVKM